MPGITLSRGIKAFFGRFAKFWDVDMDANLRRINDHLYIPADVLKLAADPLPGSPTVGLTVLNTDTGTWHVYGQTDAIGTLAWTNYQATRGLFAVTGAGAFYGNTGAAWLNLANVIGSGFATLGANTFTDFQTLHADPTAALHAATKGYVDGRTAQATETVPGVAELATQAETNTGANDLRIVTPLKLAGWNAARNVRNTLLAAFSSTVTTPAEVTGWSVNLVAGKSYKVSVIANYQTVATNTGVFLGLAGTAAGTFAGSMRGAISAAAVSTELARPVSSMASSLLTTGVSAANTPHYLLADFIVNCTGSGTLQITFASEVASSAVQLNAGSVFIVNEV